MSQLSRELPPELNDKVFENLSDDIISLVNSSLVNHSFHSQTQRHLFRKITLRIGPDPHDVSNLQNFLQATDIAQYVKELTVVARTPHAAGHVAPHIGPSSFPDIGLLPFSGIEKLMITTCCEGHGVLLHNPGSITDLCRQFIRLLLSHPSINELSLHNICEFNYLSLLPRPRTTPLILTLSGLSSLSPVPVTESNKPPINIGTLKFKSTTTSSAIPSILRWLGVQQPTIRLTNNTKIEMQDDVESSELSFFWTNTGAILEDITICVSKLDTDRNRTTSLIGLRGLLTIEFYHSDLNMSPLPRRAALILSSLPSYGTNAGSPERTTLTSITFTYDPPVSQWQSSIPFGTDQRAWNDVDAELVNMCQLRHRLDGSSVIYFKLGRNAHFSNDEANLLPLTRSAGVQVRLQNI